MIRRVDRYVFKELLVPFVIGTIVIAMLFVANEFIAIFKNFDLANVPPLAILQLVVFKVPYWLSLTLPTGMALAAALAVSRLARESELTAMRAAGIPIRRVVLPIACVGLMVAVLNWFVVEKLVPPSSAAHRKLLGEFVLFSGAPAFQSNVMRRLDRYTVWIGSVRRVGEGQVMLEDILLIERPSPGQIWLYTAEQGTYYDGVWRMQEPMFRKLDGMRTVSARSTKEDLVINERINIPELFAPPDPAEQTAAGILAAIERGRAAKQDTRWLETAYHVKFSIPASCLVFSVTGALFAVWLSRAGPYMGVLLSLGLVLMYYNAHVISTEILGRNGWVEPWLAAWLPNILFLIGGVAALRRVE